MMNKTITSTSIRNSRAHKLILIGGVRRKSEDSSLKNITHHIIQISTALFESEGLNLYDIVRLRNESRRVGALIVSNNTINPGEIYVPEYLRKRLQTPVRGEVTLELGCETGVAKSILLEYERVEQASPRLGTGILLLGEVVSKTQDITSIKFASYFVGRPLHVGFRMRIGAYRIYVSKINDNSDPHVLYRVNNRVTYKLQDASHANTGISWADIGGLREAKKKISETIAYLRDETLQKLLLKLQLSTPRGILLHGPPGTGKTLLLRGLAATPDIHFQMISTPELSSIYHGQAEKKLRQLFKVAQLNAPSVIAIDELAAIAGRSDLQRQDKKILAQLLSCMDGLKRQKNVLVIAATKDISALPDELLRNGRFDCEIQIGIPSERERIEILTRLTKKMGVSQGMIAQIAGITHGFVGADLMALVNMAGINAINDHVKKSEDVESKVLIDIGHFREVLKILEPSAMKYYSAKKPTIKWSEIGGLKKQIDTLVNELLLPRKYFKIFKKLGCKPLRGAVLYGPPGTGKTLIAKAIANELNYNFISLKGPQLINKYVGETEAAIRRLFKRARYLAPCIVFIDEVDALSATRDLRNPTKVTGQLLAELDGLNELNDVIVITTTNRLSDLDPALLRAGRLELKIKIDIPDRAGILEILNIHFRRFKIVGDMHTVANYAYAKRLVGADIAAISRRLLIKKLKLGATTIDELKTTDILSELRDYCTEKNRGSNPLAH